MPRAARVALPSMLYHIVREAKQIVCIYLILQNNMRTVPNFLQELIVLGVF